MIINEFWYLMRKIDLLMTKLECFSCKFRKVSSKRKLILPIKSHSPFGIKLLMSPPGSFRIRSSCKKSFNFRCVALLFSDWLSLHVRQQKLLHLELGCNSCQSHRYTLFISVHITFDKTTRTI